MQLKKQFRKLARVAGQYAGNTKQPTNKTKPSLFNPAWQQVRTNDEKSN